MSGKNLAEGYFKGESCAVNTQSDKRILQAITLILLALFWIGYGFALYRGNEGNAAGYSHLISLFSLINSEILFTRKRAENDILNIFAKIEGILFFIWVAGVIIQLIIK